MTTTEKTCFKCERVKPIDEFYPHPRMSDGRLNKCKTCTKRDVSKNYRDNINHYVAYEHARAKTIKRKQKSADHQKQRRQTIKGRTTYMTTNAIRDGRLARKPCEKCGAKAEAHHDDYSKPLEVRWLCRKHHLENHGKEHRAT